MDSFPIRVYIYDISKGLARSMSQALLGKQIDGVWHTGVVAYGQEVFFGSDGINSCPPGGTILGHPDTICELGETQIPEDMFMDYLSDLASSTFRPESYHLFDHNCNNFSSEVAQFLTGKDIPSHITNLPAEVMDTPLGAMMRPFIDSMSSGMGFGHPMFSGSNNSNSSANTQQLSAVSKTSDNVTNMVKTRNDQPKKGAAAEFILYKDAQVDLSNLKQYMSNHATPADVSLLEEIDEYLSVPDCSWSLGGPHIEFLGKLLLNKNIERTLKMCVLKLLQKLCLMEDVINVVVREESNRMMIFVHNWDDLSHEEQAEAVKVLSNCCRSTVGFNWLVRNKEWPIESRILSNCRITGACCVNCLLHDDQELRQLGSALACNVTFYKISDDLSVEIGSAVLQCLMGDVSEPTAFYCLSTLKLLMASNQEVADLACVMGVDSPKFKQMSPRLEKVVTQIQQKLQ